MVSINLPESCEKSEKVSIDIPFDDIKRSFKKVLSDPRPQGTRDGSHRDLQMGDEETFKLEEEFGYWYGEDPEDGSTFNYVQDEFGNMAGSMVDMTKNTVMQFQIEDGEPVVIITNSEDFPPEEDPLDEEDYRRDRKLYTEEEEMDMNSAFLNEDERQEDGDIHEEEEKEVSPKFMSNNRHLRSRTGILNNIVPEQQEVDNGHGSSSSRSLSSDDSGGNLDIMVVWTRQAECRKSGLSSNCTPNSSTLRAMQAEVNLAVQETNTAFRLSGVNTRLLLVHAYRHSSYEERKDDRRGSIALRDITHGRMSGVPSTLLSPAVTRERTPATSGHRGHQRTI